MVGILESGAVEVLRLAAPLAKAIPLLGSTVEGSIMAVLHILRVKDVHPPPYSTLSVLIHV